MPTPILATKLYIPPPPPGVVLRPHLLERLNEGLHRKLTLIAAPAGFGKSTLLSEWVAGCNRPVAWLSLDAGDSDPARFLTYFVAALRTIAPNIGEEALELLQSPQLPQTEAILTALLNEITTISHNFVLVLDDYHVIDTTTVDQGIAFLLEHQPPQMHLVITSREDPQIPLARLRSRGQLTELRVADLRFTTPEAAEFLHTMGLNLSVADVAALEARTEGWIAGLQLAAISMQGHENVHAFIRAFAGDHRYIADYLVEEVLQRQPESVRSFLLQTSILDRLNGPLCDAVTGQEGGKARLEALERGNFFVIPLDDKRHWYRYHHLFAEVLYAHLMAETADKPGQVATLHRRASEWYEHNGSAPDAIRHALAAEDFERAADLVERAVPAMLRSRQEATLLGWLKALPDELLHNRPVLSVWYAHVLLASGELDGIEARLRDAERWLDPSGMRNAESGIRNKDEPGAIPHSEFAHSAFDTMVVVDEEAFRHLPGAVAVARAGQAMALGDVSATVKYAQLALDLVPEGDHLRRGSAAVLLGLASWTSGDLEAAHRSYVEGMASLQRAGNISDVLGCAIALADICIAQGRLHEAMGTYEWALQLATRQTAQGEPVMRGTADMHVGMSALYRERGDLNAATQQLLRSKELGEHTGLPQNRYRWCVAMSRIHEAQGDLDAALDLLHEAERVYVGDFSPNVRPVAASRSRVWVMQGRFGEALGWARERGLSVEDDLSYLREFEHISLARLFLARYRSGATERSISEALGLLERLLKAAEEGGRTGSVIEILILQALAHQIQGDITSDLRPSPSFPRGLGTLRAGSGPFAPLERALTLAEPEGYVRLFVDEGMPMVHLLREGVTRGIMPEYAGKLQAAFEAEQKRPDTAYLPSAAPAAQAAQAAPDVSAQPLIEPLSERELDVLRLLGTELSGPEVANELMVSLSTMRTHTRNIYNKLGVDNRRAAVRRAEELHLL